MWQLFRLWHGRWRWRWWWWWRCTCQWFVHRRRNMECNMAHTELVCCVLGYLYSSFGCRYDDDAFLLPNVDYDFDLPFLRCRMLTAILIFMLFSFRSFNFIWLPFRWQRGVCVWERENIGKFSPLDLCDFVTSNFRFIICLRCGPAHSVFGTLACIQSTQTINGGR